MNIDSKLKFHSNISDLFNGLHISQKTPFAESLSLARNAAFKSPYTANLAGPLPESEQAAGCVPESISLRALLLHSISNELPRFSTKKVMLVSQVTQSMEAG